MKGCGARVRVWTSVEGFEKERGRRGWVGRRREAPDGQPGPRRVSASGRAGGDERR